MLHRFVARLSVYLPVIVACGDNSPSGSGGASSSGTGGDTSSTGGPTDPTGDVVPTGDTGSPPTTTSSSDDGTTGTTTTTTTGGSSSTTGSTDTGGESSSGDPPVCGDGVVAGDEACDDANDVADDGCEFDCTWTPCAVIWQIHEGVGMTTAAYGLAVDAEGHPLVVGDELFDQPQSESRVWKYDSEGAQLWQASPLGQVTATLYSAATTADGDVIVVGDRTDGPFVRNAQARYSGDGALLWAEEAFAEKWVTRGVAVAADGAILVAGYHPIGLNIHAPLRAALGPDGGIEWTVTALPEGATTGTALAVAVDPDGDLVFAGGVTEGAARLWIERRTFDGGLLWSRSYDSPAGSHAIAVAIGPDGTLAIAGAVGGEGRVATFDPVDGEPLWDVTLESGSDEGLDWARGLAFTATGELVTVADVSLTAKEYWYRGAFRKFSAAGELLCERVLEPVPGKDTFLRGLALAPDGHPFIAGIAASKLYLARMTP